MKRHTLQEKNSWRTAGISAVQALPSGPLPAVLARLIARCPALIHLGLPNLLQIHTSVNCTGLSFLININSRYQAAQMTAQIPFNVQTCLLSEHGAIRYRLIKKRLLSSLRKTARIM